MLSRFLATAHLARFLVTPARPALSNVVTRSFIVSLRVASPKATQPKTTDGPKEKNTKTKSKSTEESKGPGRPKSKETSKKILITDDMKPPKRPTSPYMMFSQDFSSKLSKAGSVEEARARAKDCSAAWHALSNSEKEQYSEDFRRRQEEYKQTREEWFKNVDPEVLEVLNKKRIAAGKRKLVKSNGDGDGDPKPLSGYIRFMSAYRQEQGLSLIDASRAASVAWKTLSEEERKPYIDRHKQEMDEWRQRKVAAGELKA
ncbi:hypothetical protein APHAL10511_007995 [Amanita phalloides]|nr:hypothetical protein APHAL10511_007995 [Amanita phalloides]